MAIEIKTSPNLSKRGWATVEGVMPKIQGAVTERSKKQNTNIDLSVAENWLLRPELVEICKDAVQQDLVSIHMSYPRGFAGDPELLHAYATFFNEYFKPRKRVEPDHLATAPGAMACVDTLLYNICDPGDGVLTPAPYWTDGYDFGFKVRSSVTPVPVILPSLDATFTQELIPALERAYVSTSAPVKALILTNPHNPLGVCYPLAVLEECLKFCKKYRLHFIADEIYALSAFRNPEIEDPDPFVSVLSIDLDRLEIKPSFVHMVWSLSKDFGQSGFRMGVTVTQSNREMAVGLALAANTQISSLSAICAIRLLSSPELPLLLRANSRRLRAAYETLTSFFRNHGVPYRPADAGLCVFARVADAETWEEEAAMISHIKAAGVLVSSGRSYHGPEDEKGWARVLFAVEPEVLREAIRRMEAVFRQGRKAPASRLSVSSTVNNSLQRE